MSQSTDARAGLWLPPLACMAAIYYFSSQPNPVPAVTTHVWDKLLHLGVYAVLAWLLARAFLGEGAASSTALVAAVLIASAYGATDEYHQLFVPQRHAELADWIVDTIGAVLGSVGCAAVRSACDTLRPRRADLTERPQ